MTSNLPLLLSGVLELILGCFWLGSLVRKPPIDQPPRVLIGRVLMRVSVLFVGSTMVMQPSTLQMGIPLLIGFALMITSFVLELRYRPKGV